MNRIAWSVHEVDEFISRGQRPRTGIGRRAVSQLQS
jgi:hypothetical protein